MPCNSDYMYPTRKELDARDQKVKDVNKYLDHLVHDCDLTREAILAVIDEGPDLATIPDSIINFENTKEFLDVQVKEADKLYAQPGADFYELVNRVIAEAEVTVTAHRTLVKTGKLPKRLYAKIREHQIVHRWGDMIRVWDHLQKLPPMKRAALLEKVATVDYRKPLIPQIGFDPDDV